MNLASFRLTFEGPVWWWTWRNPRKPDGRTRGAAASIWPRISARATPTRLAEGEPLTLSLTVEGEAGALEAVRAVHLAGQALVFRDFQVVRDDPVGRLQPGKKVFDYVIRPRRAGIDRIPRVAVATFDLGTGLLSDAPSPSRFP